MAKSTQGPSAERVVATVARLYHHDGVRQSGIAERLQISQSRVSRLFDEAVDLGIVRTLVVLPSDEKSALEEDLESAYGLQEAHVYDVGVVSDEIELVPELGQLVALHLQSATLDAEVIGITSWSRTLSEMVRTLQSLPPSNAKLVVELLGDLGPPPLQHRAAENTRQLADLAGAEPMFLRVPGVMPNREVKQTWLEHNSYARATLSMFDELDFALTGIGACGVAAPLRAGDNFFTEEQIAQARIRGAVGEINLRYITEDGEPVLTDFDDLIVGATLGQLRRAERRLVVAGGASKYRVIRAALVGGWVNMVFTDSMTARWLINNRG